MENHHMFKFGKPSISIRAIYGYVSHNQRLFPIQKALPKSHGDNAVLNRRRGMAPCWRHFATPATFEVLRRWRTAHAGIPGIPGNHGGPKKEIGLWRMMWRFFFRFGKYVICEVNIWQSHHEIRYTSWYIYSVCEYLMIMWLMMWLMMWLFVHDVWRWWYLLMWRMILGN